jgi:hypothetical protein
MQSIACTLALKSDPSQKANLSIVRDDDDNQFWKRFGSDIGGLQLFDDHGTWEYEAEIACLVLWYAARNPDGTGSGISLQKVPSNFFRAVTCGRSIGGDGNESGLGQELQYTLWFGCV